MANSNFQVWNPNQNNQLSDAAYTSDALRSNGAPSGAIFPSPTANKVLFQVSMLAAAFAQMMIAKGYDMFDSNESNLITSLSNVITKGELSGLISQFNLVPYSDITFLPQANGYLKIGGPIGFILQWGQASAAASSVLINFPLHFPNAVWAILPVAASTIRDNVYVQAGWTTSSFSVGTPGSTINVLWAAIGH